MIFRGSVAGYKCRFGRRHGLIGKMPALSVRCGFESRCRFGKEKMEHHLEKREDRKICLECKKVYIRVREEQAQGFHGEDYDICPYCKAVNGMGTGWDYYNRKLEETE